MPEAPVDGGMMSLLAAMCGPHPEERDGRRPRVGHRASKDGGEAVRWGHPSRLRAKSAAPQDEAGGPSARAVLNSKTRRASLRAGFERSYSLWLKHHASLDQSTNVHISFAQ